jgi:hypothetical protein
MLNKAIELAMTYPHLEQDSYCSAWPEPPGDGDQRERYDNYCCFVFNIIEQAWSLEKKRPKRVEMLVPVREHAWRHHRWWNTEDANESGYDLDFVRYVDDVIIAEAGRRGSRSSEPATSTARFIG